MIDREDREAAGAIAQQRAGGDLSCGAGNVAHDNRAPDKLRERLAKHTRENVGSSTGRIADDDLQRTVIVALRGRAERTHRHGGEPSNEAPTRYAEQRIHLDFPWASQRHQFSSRSS